VGLSGRSQRLLAYLLLHRRQPQPRERLAFQLWPDSGDAQARANLRKELSQLRRTLPSIDRYLSVTGKTLQWLAEADYSLDVAAFETACRQAQQAPQAGSQRTALEQAVEHYGGDLLPDFDDEWVLPDRERLRQLYGQSLEELVTLLTVQQDYRSAIAYGQRWLRCDRLNESAYAALMRLYGHTGDRASALQTYHQCMALLREELGLDPSPTTRQLYDALLNETALPEHRAGAAATLAPDVPLPKRLPLIGREAEWAALRHWASPILHGVPPGQGGGGEVLVLVGEPGIGKTRLLEELRAQAQARQARVLWGQSFAAEMMRPFGLWVDLLRAAGVVAGAGGSSELGFLLPELGQPAQAPADLSHLFDAVVRQLTEWARQTPLLVLLDDIQWMDEASSALLHYALRLLRPLPVGVACTARSAELERNAAIAQVLQAVSREQRLHRFHLQPLDLSQTADLVRRSQAIGPDRLSEAEVEQVFRDSGGNPLYALEMARVLAQDGAIAPATLEGLICDRLGQLDETARDFLPWAAALGRRFDPATVARIADYPLPRLITTVEQLEQRAIIRPQAGADAAMGYDFAHDRVRQVVYQQLSEPRRRLIHGQIAQHLQAAAAQDEGLAVEVAYHAALAHDYALAAAATLGAAERCLRLFAYSEAFALARQGIDHCQQLETVTQVPLRAHLLRVCVRTGLNRDRATQIQLELQQLIEQAQRLGLAEAAAVGLEAVTVLQFEQSNFAEVHQQSLRAAETSRRTSPATAARMLAHSGTCLAEIGRDMLRAEGLLLEAQSLADRMGIELCDGYGGLGCVHRHYGRYDEARSHLQRAWHLAAAQQDHWREFNILAYLVMLEIDAGSPAVALPHCDQMATVAEQIQGEGSEAVVAAALRALIGYRLQPEEGEVALETAIAALHTIDARRMLAFVLSRAAVGLLGACPQDFAPHPRLKQAVAWAKAAYHSAQVVEHPSETVFSGAIWIQSLLILGERKQAALQFETLQLECLQQTLEPYRLSAIAQAAVDRLRHALLAPA
jgi:DNA-binding SARP family transcriptional activator/predicted ATPase